MLTKFFRAAVVLATTLFFAATTPDIASSTTLVDQGNNTALDTHTGLLWLDVNLTLNVSKTDVINNLLGAGETYFGWRYATGAEVSQMFTDGGVTNPKQFIGSTSDPAYNGEGPEYLALINLLGPTGACTAHNCNLNGYVADMFNATTSWRALLSYGFFTALETGGSDLILLSAFSLQAGVPVSTPQPTGGSFLVRDFRPLSEVPLPAALPLFATGLGAMGLLGWRRKRKALAA